MTYEVDIPVEIGIAAIVDVHVRYQLALKPTVTGQSAASNFNNFIDLNKSESVYFLSQLKLGNNE